MSTCFQKYFLISSVTCDLQRLIDCIKITLKENLKVGQSSGILKTYIPFGIIWLLVCYEYPIICCLFNDAVSGSDHTASNDKDEEDMERRGLA
jgi:hypothetical protein